MSDVLLFDYCRSSASYRVRIALNLAQISYQSVSVDLLNHDQKSATHLARNPQGLVPVLNIDGHRLSQSLAIIDYLDQTRGLGLLPLDPVQRAKVSGPAQSLAIDVHPICNLPVVRYAAGIAGDKTIKGDWMQRFIGPGLTAFEALLDTFKQDPFCSESKPGLADIFLIPQLYNASRWNVSFADCPKICAIAAHCAALPAFGDAHPDRVKP
jgi:maleylacetoacetate isomerase